MYAYSHMRTHFKYIDIRKDNPLYPYNVLYVSDS